MKLEEQITQVIKSFRGYDNLNQNKQYEVPLATIFSGLKDDLHNIFVEVRKSEEEVGLQELCGFIMANPHYIETFASTILMTMAQERYSGNVYLQEILNSDEMSKILEDVKPFGHLKDITVNQVRHLFDTISHQAWRVDEMCKWLGKWSKFYPNLIPAVAEELDSMKVIKTVEYKKLYDYVHKNA